MNIFSRKEAPRQLWKTDAEQREILVSFLRHKCIIQGSEEKLVSSKGTRLNWVLDNRVALLNPQMAEIIAMLYWECFKDLSSFQLACLELTGIPLMVAIQSYCWRRGLALNGIILRKEEKVTGRQRQLEGDLNELPIVFVDDVMNSGSSIWKAQAILEKYDRRIDTVVALVDFGAAALKEQLLVSGIAIRSLVNLAELGVSKTSRHNGLTSPRSGLIRLWRVRLAQGTNGFHVVPRSSPALDKATLYFGDDTGVLHAIDQTTGATRWAFSLESSSQKGLWATPCVCKELVCVGGYDGNFYAVDRLLGVAKWIFREADWIGSSACYVMAHSLIYVGLEHSLDRNAGSLVALDEISGEKKWEFFVGAFIHSSPTYCIKTDSIVFGCNLGQVYCVDAKTGAELWRFNATGAIKSIITYDDTSNTLTFGAFDGFVYNLEAENGNLRWRTELGGAIYSQPLLSSSVFLVSCTDKHLYALQAQDGSITNKINTGAKLFSSPALIGSVVYCCGTDGRIWQISTSGSAVLAVDWIPHRLTCQLIQNEETQHLFLTTLDGFAYSFKNALPASS